MEIEHKNGSSDTATTCQKRRNNGRPFKKGADPRRNMKGRPQTFDALRKICQEIGHEQIIDKNGRALIVIEAVMRKWAVSSEPVLQKAFVEYAFGKVPDKLEASGPEGAPLRPMVIQVITPAAALVIDRECPSEIARSESGGLKGLTMKSKSANEAESAEDSTGPTLD